jgi:hypothetical protein
MNSTINITFAGTLKSDITENDVSNVLKSFIFFQTSYLFEHEPKSSFQVDNGDVIPLNDTIIPVKSLIPKNENRYVDIIVQKEWQLAYPSNGPVKCITDRTFVGQYRFNRNRLILMKMKTNKKGE